MFNWIINLNTWFVLGVLIVLEIILGIDNIIFLSMVIAKLPPSQQKKARYLSLFGALIIKFSLLKFVFFISNLIKPLFYILEHPISGRDSILFFGGAFLTWKSCREIFKLFDNNISAKHNIAKSYFISIIQIIALDIILSLDSIIAAISLSSHILIILIAIIISMGIMLFSVQYLSRFIEKYVSIKILILLFLFLFGCILMLESIKIEIPKSYLYFAIVFSLVIEIINIFLKKNDKNNLE